MPRISRTVFADMPHHIKHLGNRRKNVFFTDADRNVYLGWLQKEYCSKHGVEILAYCLMTNHIHLVVVPNTEEGLQRVLKPLHILCTEDQSGSRLERPLVARTILFITIGRCVFMGRHPLC